MPGGEARAEAPVESNVPLSQPLSPPLRPAGGSGGEDLVVLAVEAPPGFGGGAAAARKGTPSESLDIPVAEAVEVGSSAEGAVPAGAKAMAEGTAGGGRPESWRPAGGRLAAVKAEGAPEELLQRELSLNPDLGGLGHVSPGGARPRQPRRVARVHFNEVVQVVTFFAKEDSLPRWRTEPGGSGGDAGGGGGPAALSPLLAAKRQQVLRALQKETARGPMQPKHGLEDQGQGTETFFHHHLQQQQGPRGGVTTGGPAGGGGGGATTAYSKSPKGSPPTAAGRHEEGLRQDQYAQRGDRKSVV